MLPRLPSSSERRIGRPRPVPPFERRVVKNGSKMRWRSPGGTPGPSSVTVTVTPAGADRAESVTRVAPACLLFSISPTSTASSTLGGHRDERHRVIRHVHGERSALMSVGVSDARRGRSPCRASPWASDSAAWYRSACEPPLRAEKYHVPRPPIFDHIQLIKQTFSNFQYHARALTRAWYRTLCYPLSSSHTINRAIQNTCLPLPDSARHDMAETQKSPHFCGLLRVSLPLDAGPCRTQDHSHSIVPGGLLV